MVVFALTINRLLPSQSSRLFAASLPTSYRIYQKGRCSMGSRTQEMLRRAKMEYTLPNLIGQYVAGKRLEGRTERTIQWYRDELTAFAVYLGPDARMKDLTLDNARNFIVSLQAKQNRYGGHPTKSVEGGGLSPYTMHGCVRALKAFSAWLEDQEITAKGVFTKLRRPKLPETMVEIFSDEEVRRIRGVINPLCVMGARTHLIFVMLLDTGIRANELITLKLANVDMTDNQFKVYGKGRKERIITINATVKEALLNYLRTFRPEPQHGADTLVLSREGRMMAYSSPAVGRFHPFCGLDYNVLLGK